MEVKRKYITKIIAAFLAAVLVMQILPLSVLANDLSNVRALSPTIEDNKTSDIDCEITDKRDEYSKTFLLEDGSYASYISNIPIHEKNSNDEWIDIEDIDTPETMNDVQSVLENSNKLKNRSASSLADDNSLTINNIITKNIGTGKLSSTTNEMIIQRSSSAYSLGYIKLNELSNPDIGDKCIVTKAVLNASGKGSGNKNNIVTAQIVDGEWPTDNNTKNHPINDKVMDYNNVTSKSGTSYQWDITEAACLWSQNNNTSNGIALVPYKNNCNVNIRVESVILYYNVINQMNNNFSYHTVDMGRAGKAYINDYTNDFYLVRNEFSVDGNKMPVSLTRTFNNKRCDTFSAFGKGWNLNYISTLFFESSADRYKWVKDDNSFVYFSSIDDTNWEAISNGISYSLTIDEDEGKITSDADDYTYIFNLSTEKLTCIEDKNGNKISLKYGDNGLEKIIDGNGIEYRFAYGNFGNNYYSNKLSLYDSNSNPVEMDNTHLFTQYAYDEDGKLLSVKYNDSKEVKYTYNNGYLTEIENVDGNKLTIEYDSNGRVISYIKASGSTILDKCSIDTTNTYVRTFTDNKGKVTRQQYDSKLNLVSDMSNENDSFLQNSDFENDEAWILSDNASIIAENDSNNVVKIVGDAESNGYAVQQYCFLDAEYNHAGRVYTIGAWVKANSSIAKDDRTLSVLVNEYINDEFEGEIIGESLANLTYDNSITDWQYMTSSFIVNNDIDGFEVVLSYNNQIGEVLFDKIDLYNGDDSSEISNLKNCVCKNCTERNCPCDCEDEESCEHKYCKRGTTTIQNGNGNQTTVFDGEYSMITNTEYSSNDKYSLVTVTSDLNTKEYYSYNINTGKLVSFNYGDSENRINYTYNALGLLKTVAATVNNENLNEISSYTYNESKISSITHNGTTYSFEYDEFGNVIKKSVGNTTLEQYADNCLTYANGDSIHYNYNENGKITSIEVCDFIIDDEQPDGYESTINYSYEYDDNGELKSYTDGTNGTITNYTDNGYTIIIPATEEETDTVIYSSIKNNETNETEISAFGYTYKEKKLSNAYDIDSAYTTLSNEYILPSDALGLTGTGNSSLIKDYFGRTLSTSFNLDTNQTDLGENNVFGAIENINLYDYRVTTNYTYITEDNITSNLVETSTSSIELYYDNKLFKTLETAQMSYKYDNSGRITHIYYNDQLISKYKYDALGQLILEIGAYIDSNTDNEISAIEYNYDNVGNILSKKYYSAEYNKETNDFIIGDQREEIAYGYDNDNWSDLLTSYNGSEITYDELGNPLNYQGTYFGKTHHNATLEWNGRLLTSYSFSEEGKTDPSQRYEYSYNSDGLRTEKRQYYWNSEKSEYEMKHKTEYIWENSILKGYRISLYSTDNSANENLSVSEIIVIPLYNTNNDVMGLAVQAKQEKENENTHKMETVIYEDVIYYVKDAQGNNLYAYSPINNNKTIYIYNAYGEIINYGVEGPEIRKLENLISNPNTGHWLSDIIVAFSAALALALVMVLYAEIDIFAYKGYMYDCESGLYYDKSGYYSGKLGRYINYNIDTLLNNNDVPITISKNNVFAYSNNNPVSYIMPITQTQKKIQKYTTSN